MNPDWKWTDRSSHDRAWTADARCRVEGVALSVFYPQVDGMGGDGGDTSDVHTQEARAKNYCYGCPVRHECLDWALANREQGIWGGTSAKDRRRIDRKRRDMRKAPAGHVAGASVSYRTYKKLGCRCDGCRAAKQLLQHAARLRARGEESA